GVDGEEVLERPVAGARLADADRAVVLVERGTDLAVVAVHQLGHVPLAGDDLPPRLHDTARSERVGLARIAEGRPRALVRFQERSRGPGRGGGATGGEPGVDRLEGV